MILATYKTHQSHPKYPVSKYSMKRTRLTKFVKLSKKRSLLPKGSRLAEGYWTLLLTVDKCLSHYMTIIPSLGPLIILEGAYDLKLVIKKKKNKI